MRRLNQLAVDAQRSKRILAQVGQIGVGRAAKALQDGLKERAQHQEFLRQTVAQCHPRAVWKDQRGHGQRHQYSEHHLQHAIEGQSFVGAGLHQHHDGDGDSSEARTGAEAKQAADDDGGEDGEDEIPWKGPEERERKPDNGADQRAENAVAGCSDGGAKVGLQHDDGADGAPVAVMQPEAQGQPPAKRRGECGFRSVDEQPLALPREQARAGRSAGAEL